MCSKISEEFGASIFMGLGYDGLKGSGKIGRDLIVVLS
jgi:hypothetical protein